MASTKINWTLPKRERVVTCIEGEGCVRELTSWIRYIFLQVQRRIASEFEKVIYGKENPQKNLCNKAFVTFDFSVFCIMYLYYYVLYIHLSVLFAGGMEKTGGCRQFQTFNQATSVRKSVQRTFVEQNLRTLPLEEEFVQGTCINELCIL